MSKSMLVGVIAGIGVATAGGVAAYQFFGQPPQQGSAVVADEPVQEAQAAPVVVASATPVSQPAQPRPAARPAAAPKPAPQPAVTVEECWDEEITETADPKDQHAIAGTAVGAVVGGAIGKDVGDRDLTTAAGAAAGAFIGRKIQQRIQENHADERTVTRVERRCAPAGTPH